METTWQGHTLRVTGNWTARYLYFAPQYELWLDDQRLDISGGPRVRPRLEAIVELVDPPADQTPTSSKDQEAEAEEAAEDQTPQPDSEETPPEAREQRAHHAQQPARADAPTRYHVEAHILSLAGFRPRCDITIDGALVSSSRIRVENVLNPFLILFILLATTWMIYIGPDVLRAYLQ